VGNAAKGAHPFAWTDKVPCTKCSQRSTRHSSPLKKSLPLSNFGDHTLLPVQTSLLASSDSASGYVRRNRRNGEGQRVPYRVGSNIDDRDIGRAVIGDEGEGAVARESHAVGMASNRYRAHYFIEIRPYD